MNVRNFSIKLQANTTPSGHVIGETRRKEEMSSNYNFSGQVFDVQADEMLLQAPIMSLGRPSSTINFNNATVTNFTGSGPVTTLTTSVSGTSLVQHGIGPGLQIYGLKPGTGIGITNIGTSLRIDNTLPSTVQSYSEVYYTTQAYVSTNSMQLTLTLEDTIVCGTLDWILGSSPITVTNGVLSCFPANGTPPSQFLPIIGKTFPIGAINVNSLNFPAYMTMDTSGNFTIQFYDQSAIAPDVTTNRFPAGASVILQNYPFTYCTNT